MSPKMSPAAWQWVYCDPVFDLVAATGLVISDRVPLGSEPNGFLGTCFLFRDDHFALTAAHCIPTESAVRCVFPRLRQTLKVKRVHRHPRADVAILELDGDFELVLGIERNRDDGVMPVYGFWDMGAWRLGSDVWSFGYPTEASRRGSDEPTPRMFKGHVQTSYEYDNELYRYQAIEFSFSAPGGLSGGPVGARISDLIIGVVTTSVDSYRVTDSVDDLDQNGVRTILEGRRIISYGLALALQSVTPWLNEHVPPPGQRV